jgi:hypothetical protein
MDPDLGAFGLHLGCLIHLFIVGLGCVAVSALCFSGGFILFLGRFISFEVCASLHLSLVVLVLGRFFLSEHECWDAG